MSASDTVVTACIAATVLSWPSHVNSCQNLAACRQEMELVTDIVVYGWCWTCELVERATMLLALSKSAVASFEMPSLQQPLRQP